MRGYYISAVGMDRMGNDPEVDKFHLSRDYRR